MTRSPDVGYCYPAPFWSQRDSGWVKSLLLFFDRLSILLPDYMYGRHQLADPTLVIPLEERGLLQVIDPNDWVDEEMTEQLAEIVVELLTERAFDDLPEVPYFHELSQSRMSYGADVGLEDMLVEELEARGLARPSEDGVSIPLHPTVRTAILVMLGQLSRAARARGNLTIHPVTNNQRAIDDLIATLAKDRMPSAGRVITLALQQVSFDLDPIPLDDLLEFREEHQDDHKDYTRDLHRFMIELSGIEDPGEREALLITRCQEMDDRGHDLRRSSRRSPGKNLTGLSLGLAGASWACIGGDILGAVLSAAGVTTALIPSRGDTVAAYSYIFATQRRFGSSLL